MADTVPEARSVSDTIKGREVKIQENQVDAFLNHNSKIEKIKLILSVFRITCYNFLK